MRLVVQRVNKASVKIKEDIVGKIDAGLFVLVGVGESDTEKDAGKLAEKLAKLRIMSDKNGKMNHSIKEVQGKLLAVSQFTLYADTTGGNRPSFIKAGKPEKAERLYEYFIECLIKSGVEVETGKFGAYMGINAFLDGPVTIILES